MSRWHMIVDCSIMPRWQYSGLVHKSGSAPTFSPHWWFTPLVKLVVDVPSTVVPGSGCFIYCCWYSWFPYYILILYQLYVVLICWCVSCYTWFSCWVSAHGYVVEPQVLAGDGLTNTSMKSVERLYMWGQTAAEKHRSLTVVFYVVLSLDDRCQLLNHILENLLCQWKLLNRGSPSLFNFN